MSPRIEAVLKKLAAHPDSSNLVVFGSLARGSADPKDVDVALVSDEPLAAVARRHPELMWDLVAIAHRFYGYLDTFVVASDTMLVRSDDATQWQSAQNAAALRAAIAADGVPFNEVLQRYGLAPAPTAREHAEDALAQRPRERA
jgi:hypothetical protein